MAEKLKGSSMRTKLDGWTQRYLETVLARGGRVTIVSGEGEGPGSAVPYHGRRTIRAIRSRLEKERAGGSRWAHVLIETLDHGMVEGYAVQWGGGNELYGARMPEGEAA